MDAPNYKSDTIVAAATPPGKGGIGIVRISGPDVSDIANRMLGFLPETRRATNARFVDDSGELVDTGIALLFQAPDSFTGEDVLELQGHGSPVVQSMLVDAATKLGARRAEPGEFSRRAFLNDKLDLLQAEAIADLIESGTAQAARAAGRTLAGEFSTATGELVEQLTRLRLHVEAAIDFPEEEVDFLSDQALLEQIQKVSAAFGTLSQKARQGAILRDGLVVVIAGKPNVGKSSLINQLTGENAAIVTDIAGTTRDLVSRHIDLDGLTIELVDTAGLRDDPDAIEAEGIERAMERIGYADLVLQVSDLDDPQSGVAELPAAVNTVSVQNKVDLTNLEPGECSADEVRVSAKTGAGIDALIHMLKTRAGLHDGGEGAWTARRRHLEAIGNAKRHFEQGREVLTQQKAGELMAEELRQAQAELQTLTGEFTSDDLLGRIFSEFCIGK